MKVFFDYEILSFCSYKKPGRENVVIMSILFSNFIEVFLRTHHSYLSKQSDFRFYEWSSVTFQKNESLCTRKDKLVREASHVSCMKNAAR